MISQDAFVKVPLDASDPAIQVFIERMTELDEILGSEDFKNEKFGKKASKYSYSPIIVK